MKTTTAIGASLALALVPAIGSAQQNYPTKPVRFVLPFPPGGGTDTLGRGIGQKLGESMGQTIVLDNRPGAGANIGAEIAAHAVPDGYTLLMTNIAHSINVTLYRKLNYDYLKDFSPVTRLASTPNILVVHPSIPAKSVKELIALAKAKPGMNYASSGSGSAPHLAGELFKYMTGIELTHIPYKGGGPATVALVAGEASMGVATMPSALPHVKSGRLRALAVSTAKRSAATPELPTIAEAGVPGYEFTTWYGVLVPTGTPKDIITRLNREFIKVQGLPDVKERLAASGFEPETSTPDEFAKYMRSEVAKWGKVVKAANLKVE
jgi:tripartite-type tricarboxylate transporter receptor subunit TctC